MTEFVDLTINMQRKALEEMVNFNKRMTKLTDLMLNPPEVKVGTTPNEVVYEENKLKLLHYKPIVKPQHPTPLVIIYALINKPYILDLQPDRSVIRNLLSQGFDVYMIDWGIPSEGDKYLTINDYVNGYIDRVVEKIRKLSGMDKISILGYCMGGSLSTMYAALHPEKVRNLIVMAAPLDFGEDNGLLHVWADIKEFDVDKIVDTYGNVPGYFLNFAFLLLDPVGNLHTKYIKFFDSVENEKFVDMFFRMEKWINDGVPVAGETYREFIKKGYQENQLIKNQWQIDGRKVDLKNITMPTLSIIAKFDHLVPPQSTMTFNDYIGAKDKERLIAPVGHIGLSVSSKAHRDLWPKVAEWLGERSGAIGKPKTRKASTSDWRDEEKIKKRKPKLNSIKGIGPSFEKKLKKAGVTNVDDLAKAEPAKLSKKLGVPKKRVNDWVKEAKKVTKSR